MSNLLTVTDIQNKLGIGKSQAYELITTGRLKAFKIGRAWKITEEALNEFICHSEKISQERTDKNLD